MDIADSRRGCFHVKSVKEVSDERNAPHARRLTSWKSFSSASNAIASCETSSPPAAAAEEEDGSLDMGPLRVNHHRDVHLTSWRLARLHGLPACGIAHSIIIGSASRRVFVMWGMQVRQLSSRRRWQQCGRCDGT